MAGKLLDLTVLVFVFAVAYFCLRLYSKQKLPKLKKIPALDAIDEAIGRSVELGRPVNMVPGYNHFKTGPETAQQLAAYVILGYVAEVCGKLGAELIVSVDQPHLLKAAENIVREGYTVSGNSDGFKPENIIWVANTQLPFAVGTMAIIDGRNVGANIFAGIFYKESLMIGEAGSRVGAFQISATVSQIENFVPTCDYVMMGEELFAAGAILSKSNTQMASIVASDYIKLSLIAFQILSIVFSIAKVNWITMLANL